MLELFPSLVKFFEEVVIVLFEGLNDFVEFLVVWFRELVEHGSNDFDWVLADYIDDMLIVLIFIEEERFELIEDDSAVLLIGQTHLLYLLFTQYLFKEIAFTLHASLLMRMLATHLHVQRIKIII